MAQFPKYLMTTKQNHTNRKFRPLTCDIQNRGMNEIKVSNNLLPTWANTL